MAKSKIAKQALEKLLQNVAKELKALKERVEALESGYVKRS